MNKIQRFTREPLTYGDMYIYDQTIMGHTLKVYVNLSFYEDKVSTDNKPKSLLAFAVTPQWETIKVLETYFHSTDDIPALLGKCVEGFRRVVFNWELQRNGRDT